MGKSKTSTRRRSAERQPAPTPPLGLRFAPSALTAAAVLAPLGLRALQLGSEGSVPGAADLRGVAADLGVASLAAAAWLGLGRLRGGRIAAALLAALWGMAYYANFEHIAALGSMAGVSYVGYLADPTFLFGSALSPSQPFAVAVAVVGSAGLAWLGVAWRPDPRVVAALGAAAVAAAVISVALPLSHDAAAWRQRNFLAANLAWMLTPAAPAGVVQLAREAGDLGGSLRIPAQGPRAKNVLLIMLEAISGVHVAHVREAHGRRDGPSMPELDRLSRAGLSFSRFFDLQRQTNRGEYALLCGDPPKLLTAAPKMSELVGAGDLPCLPAALRDAGYETVYLQAAPLPFMLKDQFMPQAGYSRVHGDEWFSRNYHRNQWGIDDRAYFEQSLRMVTDLEDSGKPWFLSLLTVGTHHPFNTPPGFHGQAEHGSFEWAVEYLDTALGGFVRELETRGVLENTLLIITSDESHGIRGKGIDEVTGMLTQGWGVMMVLAPGLSPERIDEPFSQLDLPLSVLDYLELPGAVDRFSGRSLFRRYDAGRWVVWGNTYLHLVAGLSPGGSVTVCRETLTECLSIEPPGNRTFAPQHERIDLDVAHAEFVARTARASLTSHLRPGPQTFELIVERSQPLIETPGMQFVFGGQFLSAPKGSRIDVDIVVELRGVAGSVHINHDLVGRVHSSARETKHHRREQALSAGETLTTRYSVVPAEAVDRIEARLWADEPIGDGLELYFHEATLSIQPPMLGRSPGKVEHEFEVAVRSEAP